MSDLETQARAVFGCIRAAELDAVTCSAVGEEPKWIQIARVGQWSGHHAGPFQLTVKEFGEMVANFKATKNREVPIDFEHACELPAGEGNIPSVGAPATGWIIDLDNRGDAGLWALVRWLEPGRGYIKSGAYKYISPAIRFNAKDRVTGNRCGAVLSSAGLTNQPFLDGMQPLAAKDVGDKKDQDMTETKAPDVSSVLLRERDEATLRLKAAEAEISSLKAAQATKVSELEATIATLKAEGEKRDEASRAEEVAAAFATWKDKKGLAESDKPAMARLLKADAEAFRSLYPRVAPENQTLLRTVVTTTPTVDPTKVERTPIVPEAADAPSFDDLVAANMAKGKTHEQALNLAYKQITTPVTLGK